VILLATSEAMAHPQKAAKITSNKNAFSGALLYNIMHNNSNGHNNRKTNPKY